MGLFDWLFGKKLAFELRLFRSDAAKYNDVKEKVGEDVDAGRASLILYHFPDVEATLRDLFPEVDVLDHVDRDGLARLRGVNLMPVAGISESFTDPRRDARRQELPLQLHLAERFPVSGPDEAVLNLGAYATPTRPCLSYVSLDDPWMAPFVERVKHMFERFDWAETECLSGTMLAGSVDNAQRKMTKSCPKPWVQADSAAEWLERNTTRR